MESLQAAMALKRAGRFSDALRVLSESKTVLARTAAEVLRADLLERVGEHAQARALAQHDGKVDAVAKALGISRKGLELKRQRLGL
jgi:DNA-binding NtrC family response regulator